MKLLNYILALIILAALGYFIPKDIQKSHKIGELEIENYALRDSITRILEAKTLKDTIRDTVKVELVAYKTIRKTDTVILVELRDTIIPKVKIIDTLKTVDFSLGYKLEGLGDPKITFNNYELYGETVVEKKLVPYKVIEKIEVPTTRRHLMLSYMTNLEFNLVRLDYLPKKRFTFNAGLMLHEDNKFIMAGFGIKIF